MMDLAQAIGARDALRQRHAGGPWLRGLGVGLHERGGYGLEIHMPERVYTPMPARMVVNGTLAPLCVAHWRWSGRPDVFDHLDVNHDGVVDEDELDALGQGTELLRDEAAGPLDGLDLGMWGGSPRLFRALDADRDGRVTRHELEEGLGPHAVRLVRGEPAHGPRLPAGAAYGWRGAARWVNFTGREDKARYMAEAAEHDAEDPQVISWAEHFRRVPIEDRAAAILRFVQKCIEYRRDPAWFDAQGNRHGVELLDSSAVGFFRGYGDCDLKARMFVALCLAAGVPAKIDPVFTGDSGFPHVRAQVCVDGTGETAGSTWKVADPTIVNSTIGHLPEHPRTE